MIVVKFGGHAMKDENGAFAQAIAAAQATGESVVVVHGGGPQIDAALKAKGVESSFVGGFRYTTPGVFWSSKMFWLMRLDQRLLRL